MVGKITAANNCIVIGHNTSAINDNAIVVGDNCEATLNGEVLVGETLAGEPIPEDVKEMIQNNSLAFAWFIHRVFRM